jgi:hypothetical protein
MLEKSLEDGISNNVDIAINNLKKRLGFFESIMESDRPGFIPAGGPALGEGELATGLQLMKGLQERGFTKEEAAAIVGNLWAESGFSTGATNPTSGAFGLMQWLGGRKARLYSYAEEKGKPVTDLDLQLDYIKWELKGGNDYETKQFAKAMAYGDDVAAKTRGFAYEVERASSSELSSSMEKRIGAADSVYTGKLVLGERKSPYNFELGKGYGSDGVRIAAELGKYIQQNLRSPEQFQAVTEHPSFGGVSNVHADGSYHYKGRAIDIGAYANEQGPILKVIDDFNKLKGIKPAQVFHAGNDPDGNHQDHIHVAYFHGGPTGKGGLIRVHGNEYVHDKDSVDAFGQPFMDIINQVENVTQRKGAAIALMNILKNYIPEYDSRYEKTVVIPVPQPQMVPVPIPSGGGGGISVMNQSQPSGRTDILNSGS